MVDHLWPGHVQRSNGNDSTIFGISQPESIGLILLDAKGHVMQANSKGQECLALFTKAKMGEPVTHLGQWSLQELVGVSTTLGGRTPPTTPAPANASTDGSVTAGMGKGCPINGENGAGAGRAIRRETVLIELPGQLFEVVVQPMMVGSQGECWLLTVREVTQGEARPRLGEPPVQATVFHWPPASPLTSNLP